MSEISLFFGRLERREKYETKKKGGNYHYARYRVAIAEDCQRRCVYCDIHEDQIGGHENSVIDHFRPWGREEFGHLRDLPTNLLHACGVCNGWKSDLWPTEDPNRPYDDKVGWIDPFAESRSDFFTVDEKGIVHAVKPPADYVIRQLRLNRHLLQRHRVARRILAELPKMSEQLEIKWREISEGKRHGDVKLLATEALSFLRLIEALRAAFAPTQFLAGMEISKLDSAQPPDDDN